MSTERINVFSILSLMLLPVFIVPPVQLPVQHRRQFTCAQALKLFLSFHKGKLFGQDILCKNLGNPAGTDSCTVFVCTDLTKHPPTEKEEKETVMS